MTPVPIAKAASLPPRLVLTPNPRPIRANTRQATGIENLRWM